MAQRPPAHGQLPRRAAHSARALFRAPLSRPQGRGLFGRRRRSDHDAGPSGRHRGGEFAAVRRIRGQGAVDRRLSRHFHGPSRGQGRGGRPRAHRVRDAARGQGRRRAHRPRGRCRRMDLRDSRRRRRLRHRRRRFSPDGTRAERHPRRAGNDHRLDVAPGSPAGSDARLLRKRALRAHGRQRLDDGRHHPPARAGQTGVRPVRPRHGRGRGKAGRARPRAGQRAPHSSPGLPAGGARPDLARPPRSGHTAALRLGHGADGRAQRPGGLGGRAGNRP